MKTGGPLSVRESHVDAQYYTEERRAVWFVGRDAQRTLFSPREEISIYYMSDITREPNSADPSPWASEVCLAFQFLEGGCLAALGGSFTKDGVKAERKSSPRNM